MSFRAIPAATQVICASFANLGAAFHVSWPWLLLLVPLQFLYFRFAEPSLEPDSEFTPASWLLGIVFFCVNLVAASSIAINWHRFLLLGEEPDGWRRLRIDGPVWRYVGNIILLGVMIALPAILMVAVVMLAWSAMLYSAAGAEALQNLEIATFLGVMLPMTILYRLSIKLPAIALDRDDYGFRHGWRDSKGHFLGILGFTVLISMVTLLPAFILPFNPVATFHDSLPLTVLAASATAVWTWIVTIVGITALTILYAIFVEEAEM